PSQTCPPRRVSRPSPPAAMSRPTSAAPSSQTTARSAGSASWSRWEDMGESAAAESPRSWTTALTNDVPSNTNEMPSTTNAQVGEPPSLGETSASIPWYAEKPAPSTKIPTAASSDQKYRSMP